jgi:diketogulonate reductase-like aldo/keto reductase
MPTRPGIPERGERGKALKDSGVVWNEVFITTKFLPRAKDPVAEAEQSLRRLGGMADVAPRG